MSIQFELNFDAPTVRDEVTETLAAIRALGSEVEILAAQEIAQMRVDKLVDELKFLRYAHSSKRLEESLASLQTPQIRVSLLLLGIDCYDFEVAIRFELRRFKTTRDSSHFSHLGKHKFAPRRGRSKLGESSKSPSHAYGGGCHE